MQDISIRTDQLVSAIECLEKEIKDLQVTGLIAPPGCWIVRYLAKGKVELTGTISYKQPQPSSPQKPKGS